MDFFAGHSWASGIANGAGPRDQESSGEAINGYYGTLLFAQAINNQALIDWARLLLAIEIKVKLLYQNLLVCRSRKKLLMPKLYCLREKFKFILFNVFNYSP